MRASRIVRLVGARRAAASVCAASLLAMLLPAGIEAGTAGRLAVTDDQAAFLAAQPITSTETFEELAGRQYPTGQHRIVISSVRYTSLDTARPWWGTNQEVRGEEPTWTLLQRFSGGFDRTVDVRLSFRDGGRVGAFGFELNPFAWPNRFELRVVEGDGTVSTVPLPQDSFVPFYVGLSSPVGIRSVLIRQRVTANGEGTSNFSLDDVSRTHIRP